MSYTATRNAVAMATGCHDALNELADRSLPAAATWRLPLSDHLGIVRRLALITHAFALAVHDAGHMARYQYSEHGKHGKGDDVQQAFTDAARKIGQASLSARDAEDRMRRHLREHAGDRPDPARRSKLFTAVLNAEVAAGEVRGPLTARGGGRGVDIAGLSSVADSLSGAATSLMSTFANEAILVDGSYEQARMGRKYAPVNAAFIGAIQSIRSANGPLRVANVVLQDDRTEAIAHGIRTATSDGMRLVTHGSG